MEQPKKTWNKEHLWPGGLDALKTIINTTGLVETTKWGGHIYTYNGKNVLAIGGFTNYFAVWFHKGVFLKDLAGVLINAQEGTTKSLRQWRFTDIRHIDEKLLLEYISEAIEVEKAGLAIKPGPKEFPMPEVLQTELDASPQMAAAFAKLSPYKQKEFLEFIGSAKRLETQAARLEKSKPMILAGIGLNDKYR